MRATDDHRDSSKELFKSLHELEISTKNLAMIAESLQKNELRRELGILIGVIVSSIDYEILPIIKKYWPNEVYRASE